ncbi:MAG TPA: HDOD domain-containing protein [Smithellaceae bacterium]|nr:HDOD domain-containing protein [Smithellaceae bacterium]
MHQEEVVGLLDTIEKQMMNEQAMGFSPEVLAILDNIEASNNEIEMLKFHIGHDVLMRVFSFANSAYYGSLSKGSIHTFYEVVSRLGMSHTKALIIIIALHLLAHEDEEVETIFARCFASAVMGKIFAEQVGMRDDTAKKVELGGLFSEIGRMIIHVYKKIHAQDDERIDDIFTDNYHPYLTERLIDAFALPDYLKTMVFHQGLVVEANSITMSGITRLAVQFVSASFNQFNNHLLIEPLPLPSGHDPNACLDHIIEGQFNAVGLGKYLKIERSKERLLPEPIKQAIDYI